MRTLISIVFALLFAFSLLFIQLFDREIPTFTTYQPFIVTSVEVNDSTTLYLGKSYSKSWFYEQSRFYSDNDLFQVGDTVLVFLDFKIPQ